MTEAQWQNTVEGLVAWCGWWAWHDHDSRRNAAGLPDLLLLRGDRLIVAELKVGRNTTTQAQREVMRRFASAGAEAMVWRPDEPPKAEKWWHVVVGVDAIHEWLNKGEKR